MVGKKAPRRLPWDNDVKGTFKPELRSRDDRNIVDLRPAASRVERDASNKASADRGRQMRIRAARNAARHRAEIRARPHR